MKDRQVINDLCLISKSTLCVSQLALFCQSGRGAVHVVLKKISIDIELNLTLL